MNGASLSAIIVAAGAGARLDAGVPKAFIELGGKPLFLYSLGELLAHEATLDAVLVVPVGFDAQARRIVENARFSKKVGIVTGGLERWQSVENGVLTAAGAEWVLVHDAARPFVTKPIIDSVLEKAGDYDCVISVLPEVDTVRTRSGDRAGTLIDRSTLVRVGTPQLFRRKTLLEAFKRAPALPSPPTDEAVLMQTMNIPVAIAWGDPKNFKITTRADLEIAEALVARAR